MKKTLTINLSGVVFNIDEDAYEILHEYLHKLEIQFSDEEEKEVMSDIETRLAELFSNTLKTTNRNVVTISDVNSAITQLGTAEEISGENKNSSFDPKDSNKENRKNHRKFYRDADNKIIGGVAAGLAAYLGLEITITRLILLLLAITILGWLIPIYLIVWIIAPEAISTTQKLEMHGVEPSIENIKNYVNSEQFRESASRVGSRLGEIFKWLFRITAIIIGIFVGFVGIIIIGSLTIALISITISGTFILGELLSLPISNTTFIVFATATLVALLIPIMSIIMATIRLIRKDNKPRKSSWGWIWFILWIIATIISITTLLLSIPNIANTLKIIDDHNFITIFEENTITEERLHNKTFNAIDIDKTLAVKLIEDTCCFVEVKGNATTLRNIKTTIEENTLKVKKVNPINNINDKNAIIIHYCSELNKIGIDNASVLSNEQSQIKSTHLELDISSAGVINVNVNCEHLNIKASSATVLNICGKTNSFTAELSSTAVANFGNLEANEAHIEASSGAIIDIPKCNNIDMNKKLGVIIK